MYCPRDLAQGFLGAFHVVLGLDDPGADQIPAGLGFFQRRDGDAAYLILLTGLFQLALHGLQFRLSQPQGVLFGEHVEIGLGGAQHEILLGKGEIGLGTGQAGVRLIQSLDIGPAENGLGELNAPGLLIVGFRAAGEEAAAIPLLVDSVVFRRSANVRQQAGARLGFEFLGLLVHRLRLGELGVVLASLLIDLDQILGMGRQAQCRACQGRDDGAKQLVFHGELLVWFGSASGRSVNRRARQ